MKTKNEDQNEYSNTDLQEMFNNIPDITKNLVVDDNLKQKYDELKQQNKVNCTKIIAKNKRDDDVCPICLDELNNGNDLDYCKYSCGKSIHSDCYNMWTMKHKKICVFCRTDWNPVNQVKYVNLSN